MINHLAIYRATHQDSVVRVWQQPWIIRTVRKLAWKVIRMTAAQRPTCIADGAPRRKKANKAIVALTFSE